MRTLFIALAVSLAGSGLAAEELPFFGELPDPGKEWTLKDSGVVGDSYGWVHFENSETGDVLGFTSWQVKNPITVRSSPVRQASIETFSSDGWSIYSRPKRGESVEDRVRYHNVVVDIRNHKADLKIEHEAIEYTYIYENSPRTMGHGYVVVVDDVVLFVQHTSKSIIPSQVASDMVTGLLWEQAKRETNIAKGWSIGIHQNRNGDQ